MTRQRIVSRVIELKEFAKDQLELEFRKAAAELEKEKEALGAIESLFRRTSEEFSERQAAGSIRVHELELFSTYLMQLCRNMEKQGQVIRKRQADLDSKQKAMVEAYKEQRVFEIMHEKILHEKARETRVGEQKEADEHFLKRRLAG